MFACAPAPPVDVDWSRHEPLAVEVYGTGRDAPDVAYYVIDELAVVRIRDIADHYLWPDRIVCHLRDPAADYLVEIQLLGMVYALWHERRGVPALHASAVVVDGRGAAFLGARGGGKTSLAAALLTAGHALLADDLVALSVDPPDVHAQPGYPMLRLWPAQADHFVGDHERLELVHPAFAKRRVPVGGEFGRFAGDAAPLRRIYLPERVPDDGIAITPLRSSAGVIELMRHAFLPHVLGPLGLQAMRLATLADALGGVDVRRLRYPTGYHRLGDVVTAVIDDLGAATVRSP